MARVHRPVANREGIEATEKKTKMHKARGAARAAAAGGTGHRHPGTVHRAGYGREPWRER